MIGTQYTERAHAKLNLTLDVGPRRDDGYHDIDSIVVRISPFDEISVAIRPGTGRVRSIVKDKRPDALADPPLPKGTANLAHRAAELAMEAWMPGEPADVWVTLVKRIPVESGLGAGSSDAASVLRSMAKATGRTVEESMSLGAMLGSDVNLFLTEGPVRMRGRGERVEPVADVPRLVGVVVRPAEGVSTAAAYAALDARERTPGRRTENWIDNPNPGDFPFGNDFEDAVRATHSHVDAAFARLESLGASPILLCGSGSCVFGGAPNSETAVRLVAALAPHFPWIKKVETLP